MSVNSTTTAKYTVQEENAGKIANWLATRGGILIWQSRDLGDPGKSVTTPYLTADGKLTDSPHWKFGGTPDRHIKSSDDVDVGTSRIVETFKVKLKGSRYGKITVNDAGTRKLESRLEHWRQETGKDAFYTFASTGTASGDIVHAMTVGSDEINIHIEDRVVPLEEWLKSKYAIHG